MDGGGMYFHYPVTVIDAQGNAHRVRMYKKDVQGDSQYPSREYLEYILHGAKENGLPDDYTRELEKHASVKASYRVPTRADTDLGSSAGFSCRTCATGE